MKSRFWLYFYFVIMLLAIAAVMFLRPHNHSQTDTISERKIIQTVEHSTAKTNTTRLSVTNSLPAVSQTNSQPFVSDDVRRQIILEQFLVKNNKPIDFYGRFIDQESNPIVGVSIKVSINHLIMPSVPSATEVGSKYIDIQKTSDSDGRFEIHGETGKGIGIGLITKDGYLPSPKSPNGFGPSDGSLENPVVFKMWKVGDKAELTGSSKFWGIAPDKRVYTIDFVKQTKVESSNAPGDIRISVVRPPTILPRNRFDWSFSIEAVNGGLIQTTDDFMYLAPEAGYQGSYESVMASTNADWKGEIDGLQFYLKSRDGQVYGRFVFDLIPDYNDASVFKVNWAVNVSGSRNLQP